MDDATQPSTQPYTDPRRRGLNNSGLVEQDVADIICILHPSSMSAHTAVATTARYAPQHILQKDQLVYEPGGDLSGVSSDDVALRFSSEVKDLGLGFCFGRNASRCDILLSSDDGEKKISNMHFRIYLNAEGILMVEDTSTNGTVVDEKLIRKDRRHGCPTTQMLVPGSIVHVMGGNSVNGIKFIVRIPSRDEFEGQYTRNLVQYLNRVRQTTSKAKRELRHETPFIAPQQMSHSHGMHWNGGSKYNVTGQIGKGAFATVYKLATKDDGALYACKELDKRRLMKNNILDHKVDSEMRIMQGLEHPNIVQFHDYFDHDNRWIYIIMEYIGGGELSSYLGQVGRLREDMVKTIARQVLHALQYLHRRKITHRDIKPDNILISSFDPLRVKLSDFGLSKVVQEETFMKTFCGTLLYCAPEVYPEYENYKRGEARKRRRLGDPVPKTSPYDQSVDMWSFGAVLFHILCGHPPYVGRGDDRGAQMLRNIMTTDADYSMLKNAGVSEEATDFIGKLLNRDPKARPKEDACFQHPWLIDVPDEFDYMELDGPVPSEIDTDLGAVAEADEDELDASALNINDKVVDNPIDVQDDTRQIQSSSEHANVKRQRVDEDPDPDQQVVMAQPPSGDVRYPSLPNLESYDVNNPSIRLEGSASGPRLFGEIPLSALQSSGALGAGFDQRSMELPEFQEPQRRDASFSDLSSSFDHASGFALSMDTPGQTHHDLLSVRPSDFGLTASSLMGAESLVGQLNMGSFTSHRQPSTDPNSDNPTTPERAVGANEGPSIDATPNPQRQKTGASGVSEQRIPQAAEFSRRIELEPHPSLHSQSSNGIHGNIQEKNNGAGSSNGVSRQQSRNIGSSNAGIEEQIADELARTIDERTGQEIHSFQGQNAWPESDAVQHPKVSEQTEKQGTSATPTARSNEEKVDNSVKTPALLGKLIPLPGPIAAQPIHLESRMTSWGRGAGATIRHVDPMDHRIPKYALEVTFWAPSIESRIDEGQDWTQMQNIVTVISTKAKGSIWVNDVELRSETTAKDAYFFGEIYTGDVITVYRKRDGFLQFKCELYHGNSVKRRSEVGNQEFVVQRAKKNRGSDSMGISKTTDTTTPTTAAATMTPTLGRTESDVLNKSPVEGQRKATSVT